MAIIKWWKRNTKFMWVVSASHDIMAYNTKTFHHLRRQVICRSYSQVTERSGTSWWCQCTAEEHHKCVPLQTTPPCGPPWSAEYHILGTAKQNINTNTQRVQLHMPQYASPQGSQFQIPNYHAIMKYWEWPYQVNFIHLLKSWLHLKCTRYFNFICGHLFCCTSLKI